MSYALLKKGTPIVLLKKKTPESQKVTSSRMYLYLTTILHNSITEISDFKKLHFKKPNQTVKTGSECRNRFQLQKSGSLCYIYMLYISRQYKTGSDCK